MCRVEGGAPWARGGRKHHARLCSGCLPSAALSVTPGEGTETAGQGLNFAAGLVWFSSDSDLEPLVPFSPRCLRTALD